jgi:hypothetical protein
MAAYDFGDLPDRHAFITNTMQPRPGRRRLYGQPEEVGGVESVDCGPSIGPIAGISRDALAARPSPL